MPTALLRRRQKWRTTDLIHVYLGMDHSIMIWVEEIRQNISRNCTLPRFVVMIIILHHLAGFSQWRGITHTKIARRCNSFSHCSINILTLLPYTCDSGASIPTVYSNRTIMRAKNYAHLRKQLRNKCLNLNVTFKIKQSAQHTVREHLCAQQQNKSVCRLSTVIKKLLWGYIVKLILPREHDRMTASDITKQVALYPRT